MSKSTHQIAVTGVDKTAKAFASIQARAIATGNRIASAMGGAIAAAGAVQSICFGSMTAAAGGNT